MQQARVDLSRFGHTFQTIESHTAGEPTRVVVSGFPEIPGGTMMERKAWCEQHAGRFRTALMCEPRGHRDMVGAVLTDPTSPDADLGVIYCDPDRWINMCGHATIGAVTVAIEAGLVRASGPLAPVTLDTPAGLVHAKARMEDGCVAEVSFENVPSYLAVERVAIEVAGMPVVVDVSFGGSFFALIDARQIGMGIDAETVPELVAFGREALRVLNETIEVHHPLLPIDRVVNAELYIPFEDGGGQRNIVISEDGQVDRSPCGTGTCAKLAALYAKGKIGVKEPFVNESFTGTRFRGAVLGETKVGDRVAVIPEITGSAYICGVSTHLIDERDPLAYGFAIER